MRNEIPDLKDQTIVIYRTGALGDIATAVPIIGGLRRLYPKSRLVLLTAKSSGRVGAEELLTGATELDLIVRYEISELRKPWKIWPLAVRLSALNPKILIYLPHYRASGRRILRDRLLLSLVFHCHAVGFARLDRIATLHGHNGVFPCQTELIKQLLLIEGLNIDPTRITIPITEEEKNHVDQLFSITGADCFPRRVCVCASAEYSIKRWPIERFIAVCRELLKKTEVGIVLIGSSKEKDQGSIIKEAIGERCANLVGCTNIRELVEVQRRCVMYLGNDTGPMHTASLIKLPCVAIFSSRAPAGIWYPWGNNHHVFRTEVECQGCQLTECNLRNKNCIELIDWEPVSETCLNLLKEPSPLR